jgi:hypothetical protein
MHGMGNGSGDLMARNLLKAWRLVINFAISEKKGNNEGQNFWPLCCTKPLHTLIHPLMCKWGIEYYEGDEIVVGKYYKKWGNSYSSYVLLKDSSVVYLYSHLMKVVKFLMPPKDYYVFGNDALFELPNDATVGI